MISLDIATFLLQWAAGGLFFLWVTTRRREVSIGYGWLMRGTYGVIALCALVVGVRYSFVPIREISAAAVVIATGVVGWVSWDRRKAGVALQRERVYARSQRIVEMTGIDRAEHEFDESVPEFPPNLDLIAPALGLVGVIAGGVAAGDPMWLTVGRTLIGALFLGCISDAMLLGHWYLTQPGLPRAPLLELVKYLGYLWPVHTILFLFNPGMIQALNGTIDDGYNGMLSWFWLACVITTIVLIIVTRMALRERYYSAVMAATGLLYLAILTAFGSDLVARAILSLADSLT